MIDLDRALADQRKLSALCAPKKIEHPEVYPPNSNYGFAEVLKAYARYPAAESVWGVIPHGVYLDDSYLFGGEVQAPVRAVFSFPRYRDRAWFGKTTKTVIPSAAPFLYALDLMLAEGWTLPAERAGTIVFPMHSTAAIDTDTDWAALADELRALPEEYQPVTVCMHWQDLVRRREREFAKRGMKIVSAGHLTDQEFLFRLIHLMSQHRFAASNGVASNLFYAVAAGLPYFLVGRQPSSRIARGHEHLSGQFNIGSRSAAERTASIAPLFSRLEGRVPSEPTAEQRQLAAEYLGLDRFKNPDDLRADLEFAKSLHRT